MNNELELRKFVAPEIITGEGASLLVKRYLSHFTSKKPLIVTDKDVSRQGWYLSILREIRSAVGQVVVFDEVTPNPKDYEAMMGAEIFLANECDLIVAIGGGSPMDCAKCISIVSTNGGHILDYEGVDQINLPGPPLICIPSTAGTAAEISQFAIINDSHSYTKKAIISKKVVPDLALIDPVPLKTMSSYLTACTGMDVLTHAIEAYVSNASSTLTNLHALEAIRLVRTYLRRTVKPGRNIYDLYNMMIASSLAGLAFSNASLGAVHAMAHSMGGVLDLPHGECNSILLEHVIDINYEGAPEAYKNVARAMGIFVEGHPPSYIKEKLKESIADLRESVDIPAFTTVEALDGQIMKALIEAALNDPCMITNPKVLTASEIGAIYERIIKTK